MASALDVENLLWALAILALPLLLALPAKLLYRTMILGMGPAERSYRSTVQKILDAGMQVEQFRAVLDDEGISVVVDGHIGIVLPFAGEGPLTVGLASEGRLVSSSVDSSCSGAVLFVLDTSTFAYPLPSCVSGTLRHTSKLSLM